MSLTAGTRLGPYQILDPIGAGGMGEVYRGKDTRLDRVVAIKVLPPHVAANPEARQRFEREARAVSSLNHPHICQLYDIGQQDGVDYLVMEYLDGETLSARLTRGALPMAQVLEFGIQVADALAQAHKQGVFHRDLKPGNIMLIASGAKLLDFGLAKLVEPAPAGGAHAAALPTRSVGLTVAGTILGTVQYMAPEQVEGKETDGRADIFSFGAILHEMVTGQRAFRGETPANVMAAILREEPPALATLQPMTPPALEHLVRSCLAKDPNARRQNAHDLMLELKWIAESGSQVGIPAPVVEQRRNRERRWMAATALLAIASIAAIAALAWMAGWFRSPPVEVGAVRFLLAPPGGFQTPSLPQAAVSPDGRKLAIAAMDPSGRNSLWVRPLDSVSAQRLDKTEGAVVPFWSPDSQFIAFFADGKLKKVPVSGGAPQTLCDAKSFDGGAWSREGTIVFAGADGALYRVAAAGGVATPATALDKAQGEAFHRWPQFLPDGRRFLYFAGHTTPEKTGIYVQSVGSQERKLLLNSTTRAAYVQPGRLLFVRDGTLLVQELDGNLQLKGEPVRVAEEVNTGSGGRAAFSVSENGVLAYRSGQVLVNSQLVWCDREGKRLGVAGEPAPYRQITLSPDEKRVLFERIEARGNVDLWLLELASGISSRLTFDPAADIDAVWSPDSRRIVFLSSRAGKQALFELVLGAGDAKPIYEVDNAKYPEEWSPDGRFVLYIDLGGRAVSRLPLVGERKAEVVLETPFDKDEFHLSPDGRWIAYNSLESGRWEVYVASFPGFTEKRQVSSGGGCQARWRKDGKELFYLTLDGKLMVAQVKTGAALETSVPRPLFQTGINLTPLWDQYAVTGDGRKFLVNEPVKAAVEQISVVIDWPAGLPR